MKAFYITAACLLSHTGLVTSQGVEVDMTPLRYCSDKQWFVCLNHEKPFGNYWDRAGMATRHQDNAYMAIMGTPPENPKYIAMFFHGQQGQGITDPVSDSVANVVAGSEPFWKWDTANVGSQPKVVNSKSVAGRFYNDQTRFLLHDETLYITVYDPGFNHNGDDKRNVVRGYSKFLDSKVESWANIDGVVMVGASRGGCLAMQLAENLRQKYLLTHTQFALDVIDPVCNLLENEFGIYKEFVDSPVNDKYKSWKTDVPKQLKDFLPENYCMRNMAIGEDVSGVGLQIRGFSHNTCTEEDCELLDFNGNAYYEQKWEDICHSCAGRDFDDASLAITVEPILSHLDKCKARFGW